MRAADGIQPTTLPDGRPLEEATGPDIARAFASLLENIALAIAHGAPTTEAQRGELVELLTTGKLAAANWARFGRWSDRSVADLRTALAAAVAADEARMKRSRAAADVHNNSDGVGQAFDYMTPEAPAPWYAQAKRALAGEVTS